MSIPRDESLRKVERAAVCPRCGVMAAYLPHGMCVDCLEEESDALEPRDEEFCDHDSCPECGRPKEVGESHCFECEQDLWRERYQGDDLEPYENDL